MNEKEKLMGNPRKDSGSPDPALAKETLLVLEFIFPVVMFLSDK